MKVKIVTIALSVKHVYTLCMFYKLPHACNVCNADRVNMVVGIQCV